MKWINKRSPQSLDGSIRFTFLKTVFTILFPHCIHLFFG